MLQQASKTSSYGLSIGDINYPVYSFEKTTFYHLTQAGASKNPIYCPSFLNTKNNVSLTYIGQGNFNAAYSFELKTENKNIKRYVIKIPKPLSEIPGKSPEAIAADKPERVKRLLKEINPSPYSDDIHVVKININGKPTECLVTPFVEGCDLAKNEIPLAILDIYLRTKRVFVDAISSGNLKKVTFKEQEIVVSIDVAFCLLLQNKLEQAEQKLMEESLDSNQFWRSMQPVYNNYFAKFCINELEKLILMIRALLILQALGIYNFSRSQLTPNLTLYFAEAYDALQQEYPIDLDKLRELALEKIKTGGLESSAAASSAAASSSFPMQHSLPTYSAGDDAEFAVQSILEKVGIKNFPIETLNPSTDFFLNELHYISKQYPLDFNRCKTLILSKPEFYKLKVELAQTHLSTNSAIFAAAATDARDKELLLDNFDLLSNTPFQPKAPQTKNAINDFFDTDSSDDDDYSGAKSEDAYPVTKQPVSLAEHHMAFFNLATEKAYLEKFPTPEVFLSCQAKLF